MPRYAMAIDLSLCVGCAACAVACKMENEVPPGVFNLWIREREVGEYPNLVVEFRPEQCLHCENPPCVPVCPTGASYQTKDGLVLVDPKKCIACGACIENCPTDAIVNNFRESVCSCPTCYVIEGVGKLTKGKVAPAAAEPSPVAVAASGCDSGSCGCDCPSP